MEKQVGEELSTKTLLKDDNNIDQLTAVASKWILDFIFIGVCRRFSEQNQDAFDDAFSTYKSISQTLLLEGGCSPEKGHICDFLARVMKGKELGTHFTEDGKNVMPLMSAAKVWLHLKDVVQDESLFDDVTLHLIVQCVAVCMDNVQKTQARGALKWFEEHIQYPHKIGVKLSTIVAEMQPYDPFLSFFSFDRLLEKVQIFLDAYIAKHPSDFLLKVRVSIPIKSLLEHKRILKNNSGGPFLRSHNSPQFIASPDSASTKEGETCLSGDDRANQSGETTIRNKRRLFSNKTSLWEPESQVKAQVGIRPLRKKELNHPIVSQDRPLRLKWTTELDRKLVWGVKRHGKGRWFRILQDYDFEGRTGVMLKDRWRILEKNCKVD
ncbi:telomeric repeat-binding factor 1 [Stigmatopora nigra]